MTSTSSPTIHTIQVGKATNKFDPIAVTADVGDIIVFSFYPANHSVVKAEYGFPCVPYDTLNPGSSGFFSGFFPIDSISLAPPVWNITINDTKPVFYYCSAPGSCMNYGMVGAINANSTQSVEEQRKLAYAADYMLEPGESFPSEASSSASVSTLSTAISNTESLTPLTTSSGSTSTHPQASHGSSAMSATKIIAFIGSSFAALLIVTLVLWLWLIKRRQKSSRVVPIGCSIDTAAVPPPQVSSPTIIGSGPGNTISSLSTPTSIVSQGPWDHRSEPHFDEPRNIWLTSPISISELDGKSFQELPGDPMFRRI